ncbi:kinase [Sutcliffiella halmapala]|uniref:kinase n=1 Tax=Sutcliffiella halmapala TaxID=79882 RepID=UPI000994FBEA|nr:kinase [Sutcliffiella halmapala]
MEDKILNIAKLIPKLEQGQRIVLGLDGLSRSGKTTLTKKVEKYLQEKNISFHLLHIDDYIVERKRRYNTGYEEWYEYYNLQWDVKYLKDNLFVNLKNSNEIQLLTYDYGSDTQRLEITKIPDTCVIIIEGVFLQRKEWRNFYDIIIFLESSRQKRFNRESEAIQSNIEKFQNRYWKAEDYYMEVETPLTQANLVIQN